MLLYRVSLQQTKDGVGKKRKSNIKVSKALFVRAIYLFTIGQYLLRLPIVIKTIVEFATWKKG